MSAQIYSLIFYCIFFFFVLPFSVVTNLIIRTGFATGVNAFVVVSNSMNPTVPVGSVIYTEKKQTYKRGDIISFKNHGNTISHRVDKIIDIGSQLYYSTKGDANVVSDFDLVSVDKIIGKTVFFLPYVGAVIIAVRQLNPLYILVLAPLLLFFFIKPSIIMRR